MNGLGEAVQRDTERLNQMARLGHELAELVDEWSVTPNGAKAQELASEMMDKARQLLRVSTPLTSAAGTA